MTVEEFEAADAKEFTGALLALWWDRKGDWDKAHGVAQDVPGSGWGVGACVPASQGR